MFAVLLGMERVKLRLGRRFCRLGKFFGILW
jgi:hypothetical protein